MVAREGHLVKPSVRTTWASTSSLGSTASIVLWAFAFTTVHQNLPFQLSSLPQPRAEDKTKAKVRSGRDRNPMKAFKNAAVYHQTVQSALYTGNGVWSSIHLQSGSGPEGISHVARFEWDDTSLAPYQNFRQLLKERKSCPPHSTMKGSFLDLPGEIRNKIYRLALIQDPEYVELSAKTNLEKMPNWDAQQHHLNRYKENISPFLGLLRVDKRVNGEAASVYYGENGFRFSNFQGIYVLDAFLRQIGSSNQALLRKITVHVPWEVRDLDNLSDRCTDSNASMSRLFYVLNTMRLSPTRGRHGMERHKCVSRIKTSLQKHGALTGLRLLLPDSFEPTKLDLGNGEHFEWIVDPAKFTQLKVQLVRLHGGFIRDAVTAEFCRHHPHPMHMRTLAVLMNSLLSTGLSSVPVREDAGPSRWQALACQLTARAQAVANGLELVDMPYGPLGDWPVPLAEDDELLEVDEESIETALVRFGYHPETIKSLLGRPLGGSWD